MVGRFEDVTEAFIYESRVFDPDTGVEVGQSSRMAMPSRPGTPQWITAKIYPRHQSRIDLGIDVPAGDEIAIIEPKVGAKFEFEEFHGEVILLEPFRHGGATIQDRREFARVTAPMKIGGYWSTTAFFFSDPIASEFAHHYTVSPTRQTMDRLRPGYIQLATSTIAPRNMKHLELHNRNERYRVIFPLQQLPVLAGRPTVTNLLDVEIPEARAGGHLLLNTLGQLEDSEDSREFCPAQLMFDIAADEDGHFTLRDLYESRKADREAVGTHVSIDRFNSRIVVEPDRSGILDPLVTRCKEIWKSWTE